VTSSLVARRSSPTSACRLLERPSFCVQRPLQATLRVERGADDDEPSRLEVFTCGCRRMFRHEFGRELDATRPDRSIVLTGDPMFRHARWCRPPRHSDVSHAAAGRVLHPYVPIRRGLLRGARRMSDGRGADLRPLREHDRDLLLPQLRSLGYSPSARWRHSRPDDVLPALGKCLVYVPLDRRRKRQPEVLRALTIGATPRRR
jgi:hypothetical protein